MSDDNVAKEPDGSQGQVDTKALAELQDRFTALQKELDAERARKADAIEERNKEREKRKKDAESKAAYDEAKQLLTEQLADAQKKIDELATYEQSHKRWTAYEEQRRTALLAQLPDDKRDAFKAADIGLLEEVVSLLPSARTPGAVPGKGGGAPVGSKPWSEMTFAERGELAEKDPALARQKAREFIRR